MTPQHADPAALTPDEAGLLDWFVSLAPAQRLDELQSRVEFLRLVRRDDDPQLPPSDREPASPRG